MNGNDKIYSDSFGVEPISKEIKRFMGNKNVITHIYRIQVYNSIMCGYFCIEIIDFVLKDKSLLDYANLSSFNEYKKNYKIIFKIIFSINKEVKMKNYIALFVVSIKTSKNLKYHTP